MEEFSESSGGLHQASSLFIFVCVRALHECVYVRHKEGKKELRIVTSAYAPHWWRVGCRFLPDKCPDAGGVDKCSYLGRRWY